MKFRLLCLALLVVPAAGATQAFADMTIEMKHNGEPQQIQVTEHKIAVSTPPERSFIFRGDQKLFWMIDHEKKTYTEMTEADAKKMGEQVSSAMAQMKEAMKDMPAEQRAMMEKMMAGKMPSAASVKRTVTPLDQTKTINGFSCKGYKVELKDGENEIWAAAPKDLKMDAKDMTAFKELAEFMKSMVPGMEQMTDFVKDYENPGEGQVPGFPVLTIAKDKAGKETSRTELVKLDHDGIAAATFDVPDGFKKTKGITGEE